MATASKRLLTHQKQPLGAPGTSGGCSRCSDESLGTRLYIIQQAGPPLTFVDCQKRRRLVVLQQLCFDVAQYSSAMSASSSAKVNRTLTTDGLSPGYKGT
jgi:hypothetical protein